MAHPTLTEKEKLAIHGDDLYRKLGGSTSGTNAGQPGKWADPEHILLLEAIQVTVALQKVLDPNFVLKNIDWPDVEKGFSHRSRKASSRRFQQLKRAFEEWQGLGSPMDSRPWCDEIMAILGELLEAPFPPQQFTAPAQPSAFQFAQVMTPSITAQQPQQSLDDDSWWAGLMMPDQNTLFVPDEAFKADQANLLGLVDEYLANPIQGSQTDSDAMSNSFNPESSKQGNSVQLGNIQEENVLDSPSSASFTQEHIIKHNSPGFFNDDMDLDMPDFEMKPDIDNFIADGLCAAMQPGDIDMLLCEVSHYAAQSNLQDFRLASDPASWELMDWSLRSGIWSTLTRQKALDILLNEHSTQWSDQPTFQVAMARMLAKHRETYINDIDGFTGQSRLFTRYGCISFDCFGEQGQEM